MFLFLAAPVFNHQKHLDDETTSKLLYSAFRRTDSNFWQKASMALTE